MSKITGFWKRSLRPVLLSALRRHLPGGMPTPRTAIAVDGIPDDGGCRRIDIDSAPRQVLPPHAVSGDLAAVAEVRARIGHAVGREAYDRMLQGGVAQPPVESFVAVLANGRVTHEAGVVMTADNALVEDLSGLGFSSDNPTNPLRLDRLPRAEKIPGTLAVLTTGPHHNYYHWLMEALPRLDLYERSGVPIDRFYAPVRQRFQRETLALLGLPRERIVPATRNAHVRADRLAVCSFHGNMSRAKTDFLFRRLAEQIPAPRATAPRIVISRGRGAARAVVNEAAMMRALEPLGFKRYRLEAMPLAAQITLLGQAECVVGPHGAGLANLVFCRPGTRVVEIGTPYRPWSCFYEIAHHRGLDYHLAMASPVNVRHFDPQSGIGDSDLRVDPDGVRDAVVGLLAGRQRSVAASAA